MKRAKTLTLIASALALTGCAASPVASPRPLPPTSLTQPCAGPVALPDRDMTQGKVETAWGRDRGALRACASRHNGLVGWAAAV